jgi:predicted enzyme related to lactoylglutathione lyase
MTEINYKTGQFVWREIMTPDTDASLRFYGELFGWKHEAQKMDDGNAYNMLKAGEIPVGGCMKLPMPNVPPHWIMSVSVTDVDATAAKAKAAGGQVYAGPLDAGGHGRYAVIGDPQGAVFSLWRSNMGDGPARPADARPGVGEFCWEQLNTSDPKAAGVFYSNVLGWSETPFGGGGGMDVFKHGDAQVASRMQTPPGVPAHWLTYVVVESLTAANARASKLGGKVMVEKIEIPTVGAISVITDNVGATLGLFENPKAS